MILAANFEKPIGQFQNTNEYADLTACVHDWRAMLGIKDPITDNEMALNVRYLKDEYPDYSIAKIKLAVKYSLKGELKVDVKPYGSFSPMYIASILNAYDHYNDSIVSGIVREKNKIEQEAKHAPKVYTHDEKVQNRITYLASYQENEKNGYTPDFKGLMFEFLTQTGLMSYYPDDIDIAKRVQQHSSSLNQFDAAIIKPDAEKLYKYYFMNRFLTSNQIDFNQHLEFIKQTV